MFEVSVSSPPNREELVAEFLIRSDATVDQPAELFREDGRAMIAFYPKPDGSPWEFPLAELLEAIGQGMTRLGW